MLKSMVWCLSVLIIACWLREGLGLADFTNPPSGSVIADFEGTQNATTITCNITNSEGTQITTQWNLENFGNSAPGILVSIVNVPELFKVSGDPRPDSGTFENQLIVLDLTRALDEVIVHCGSGASPRQANITLRIYRPPNLRDNFNVKLRENSENIPVDLRQEPLAFPEPTIPGSFMWTKDGQPLTGFDLTYSNVIFTQVRRADAGNYAVTATNYVGNTTSTEQIGTDTGSFYLDVIYGPSFASGSPTSTPIQRYVLLGNSLSLVCGRGLDSNPNATVTWTAPDNTEIMENARYHIDNGPEVVRLNFTRTIMSDNGIWQCEVTVRSARHVLGSDGMLVLVVPEVIGSLTQEFLLTVIAQPDPPHSLGVENIGATWVRICWTAPIDAESPISRYEVIARQADNDNAMPVNISTANDTTFINVTGLLPGTTYNLTVVAIVEGGEVVARSEESDPLGNITTITTVPEVVCPQPVSNNGSITVSWSYVHTGGLPLSAVSVQYTFQQGASIVTEAVLGVDTSDIMTKVRNLLAGEMYTFTVSATNRNGSSSDDCPPVNHVVGVPATPIFGTLRSGPQAGEVTIQIKTVASGVDRVDHKFRFLITPVLGSTTQTVQQFDHFSYQSGNFVSITVGGLENGRSYTFSATATNIFGTSDPASSPPQFAAGVSVTQPSQEPPSIGGSASAGAIAGGVVGGFIVVIIAVVIIVIVALLLFTRARDQTYKVEGGKYHKASTSDPNTVKIEEVPVNTVDIGTDLQNTAPKEDHEIQYAELESFRPPSQQKNTTNDAAPVQLEEPVEYAMITGFKKTEDDTAPLDPTPAPAEDDPDKAGTSTTLV